METGTLDKKIAKLPQSLKLKLEGIVDAMLELKVEQNLSNDTIKVEKGFGGGKGLIIYMADDFEAPLPLNEKKLKREFGSLRGFVTYMADDFNDPLDEFKDYM